MIEELIERLETELDELNNGQLKSLITEYEHTPLLGGVLENLAPEEDEDTDEEDEVPLLDGDWDAEEDDE